MTSRWISAFRTGETATRQAPWWRSLLFLNASRSELASRVSSDQIPRWERDLLCVLIVLVALNMVGAAGAENAPRQDSTPVIAGESRGAAAAASSGLVMAPVWQVGDEWRYSYKSPSDSGTFVWSVNRIESLDEIPHYVIKSGTREILYRVSDLAFSLERVDGVVVDRAKPARLSYVWPLAVGKTWEQSYVREQPVDRQTTNRESLHSVDREETITVPAGTFRTLKVVWRNKYTGALINEMWYAPDVKLSVKIREVLSSGIRERELLGFKVKQTLSTAPPAEPDGIVPSTANALPPAKPAIRRGITKISGADPTFPRAAIAAGIEKGHVVSRVLIGETGNVYGVTIVKADPPGHFDQAVIEALREWKFQGDGNKYVGEIEINFELKDGRAAVAPPMAASIGISRSAILEVGRVTLRLSDDGWENVGAGQRGLAYTGEQSGDIQYETVHLLLRGNAGEFRAALVVGASRGIGSVHFTWSTNCQAGPNVYVVDSAGGNFRGSDCLRVSGITGTQRFLESAEPGLLAELTARKVILPNTAYVVIYEKAIENGAFTFVRMVFAADFKLPDDASTPGNLPAAVKPEAVAWGLRLAEAARSSIYSLSGALLIPPVTAKAN